MIPCTCVAIALIDVNWFSILSDFYQTLKKRVDDYFKNAKIVSNCMFYRFYNFAYHNEPQDPKIDYWMFLRYAVFLLLSTSCWLAGVSCFYHSQECYHFKSGCRWGTIAVCLPSLHLVLDGVFSQPWLPCHVPMMQGMVCIYVLEYSMRPFYSTFWFVVILQLPISRGCGNWWEVSTISIMVPLCTSGSIRWAIIKMQW